MLEKLAELMVDPTKTLIYLGGGAKISHPYQLPRLHPTGMIWVLHGNSLVIRLGFRVMRHAQYS